MSHFWTPEQLESAEQDSDADPAAQPASSATFDVPPSGNDAPAQPETDPKAVAQAPEAEPSSACATPTEPTASDASEGKVEGSGQEAVDSEKEPKEEEKKAKVASIDAILKARQDLIAVLKSRTDRSFDVSLQGVQTGQIEAVVKDRQQQVRVAQASNLSDKLPIYATISPAASDMLASSRS